MSRECYATHIAYPSVQHEPEVMFGEYEGEMHGEMAMRWYQHDALIPRLECFNDAWAVLGSFQDVIAALAERDDENITPEEFIGLLVELGFSDRTDYGAAHRRLLCRAERLEMEAARIRQLIQKE